MSATLPNTDSALPLSADGLSDHPKNSTSTTPTTAGPITDAGSQCKSTCRFTPESLNAPNALTTPQRSNDFEQSPLQSATAGGQKPLIESDGDRSRPTDLPAALDELDAKDKEIKRLRGALTRIEQASNDRSMVVQTDWVNRTARDALKGRDSE